MSLAVLVTLLGAAWCAGAVLLAVVLCVTAERLKNMPDDDYGHDEYDEYK